jgi:hypothetical protein
MRVSVLSPTGLRESTNPTLPTPLKKVQALGSKALGMEEVRGSTRDSDVYLVESKRGFSATQNNLRSKDKKSSYTIHK